MTDWAMSWALVVLAQSEFNHKCRLYVLDPRCRR